MRDEILRSFLETQRDDALALAAESDLIELAELDLQTWIATFRCRSLVRDARCELREHDCSRVGIRFPETYLRSVNPAELLTWLEPREVWHPNVRPPFVCIGDVAPGTPFVDLLHRLFEVISFENVTPVEHQALNPAACPWARSQRDRFPIDRRPLKRAPVAEATWC